MVFSGLAARGGASSIWSLFALCCALGLATMAGAHAANKPGTYGKKLVASYELPIEALAQFARFVPKKTSNPATLFAETQDWVGPELPLVTGDNPYTLVVKVTGVVKEDGDAMAYFQPGWGDDSGKSTSMVMEVGKPAAKAGELLERQMAIAPISVKDNKSLQAVLGLASAKNINITSVSVEVWSGMARASLPSLLMAWSPLLGGVVFLLLFLWWRR